jgi:hypothetical protein
VRSERTVLASSCEQAAEAAVAVLVTTLGEPETAPPAAQPAVLPPSPAPAPAGVPPSEPPSSAAASRDAARIEGSIGAAFGVELGTLPQPAAFAQLMGGVAWGRLLLRAEGAVALPVSAELEGTGAGAEIGFVRGTLTGCYRAPWTPGLLGACAGFELGSVSAAGFGVENDDPGSALWSAGVLAGVLRVNVAGPFAVSGGAELLVPFRSVEIVVRPEPPLHETYWVTGRFWLGAELVFR